jgi:hypothetical protein
VLALCSLLLAYFSWKFIETPFRKRGAVTRNKVFVFTVIGLVSFSYIGVGGHLSNGYVDQRSDLPFVKNKLNIDNVYEERQAAIRAGICHFNSRGENRKIEGFLSNWACIDSDEDLKATGILITGDSHSADKALALRINGFDSFQIGGAGCQLSEDYVAINRSYCKRILSTAYNLAEDAAVKAVFLSERFKESELSLEYLQSIFNYWSSIKKPVFLW